MASLFLAISRAFDKYVSDDPYVISQTGGGSQDLGTGYGNNVNISQITNPDTVNKVFELNRFGTFSHRVTLSPNTQYRVRILTAETGYQSAGQRMFNFTINGVRKATNYDAWAESGGVNKGIAPEWAVTTGADGIITTLLESTASNGQIFALEFIELSATDTTAPATVTNLTVDASRNLNSDTGTDNVGVVSYITQRRINGSAWTTLSNTNKSFQDSENLPNAAGNYTLEYQRKAKDAAGNQSANWSNIAQTTYTVAAPQPAPVINSTTPLPTATVGQPYNLQLSGTTGTWSLLTGNLPAGALSLSGAISIARTGSSNYSFSVRLTNSAGQYTDKAFTIPVSALAIFDFCYKYPLQIEHSKTVRISKPRQGARQTRTDSFRKRKVTLNIGYVGRDKYASLLAFWDAHYPDKNFLFYDDLKNEYFEAYITTPLSEQRNFFYGYGEMVIEEV